MFDFNGKVVLITGASYGLGSNLLMRLQMLVRILF